MQRKNSVSHQKIKEKTECMEFGLPELLQKSIDSFTQGKDTSIWDCLYCELQSDINVAEQSGLITTDQAWFLREKYLGLSRSQNGGSNG